MAQFTMLQMQGNVLKAIMHINNLQKWYSCGQPKPTNINGNSLMAGKVAVKCADMSREASGQIPAMSHKPLWRKCQNTEIVPKFLASTPKSAGKNMKNSTITSFHGEQSAHQVLKQDVKCFSWKKSLTLIQIRALGHDIDHRTKKCHHQSATRLWEIPFDMLFTLSDQLPTEPQHRYQLLMIFG